MLLIRYVANWWYSLDNKCRFMMGSALVVNLVNQMEGQLSKIFDEE